MNLQEPFRIHQVDLDNIVYTKIKTNDTKKIIFIKYKDGKTNLKPFVIQIPSVLNLNTPVKITEDYYELEIPLITQEKEKNISLINFFEDLDKKIIQDAKNNSKIWFDNITNTNSIKYKKLIKESDVYKEGILKIKIIKNNDFETILQIANKKKLNIKELPSNSWCKMLLEIYAIVINSQNDTFSLFLRPVILSFKEKEVSNYNYKFLDDSDSEKDEINIPDTELNSIFIKNIIKDNSDNNSNITSSQINFDSKLINKNILSSSSTESSTEFSTTSSSSKKKSDKESNIESIKEPILKEITDENKSSETSEDS